MSTGGSGTGGSCGLAGARSGTWSEGTATSGSSWGFCYWGSVILACSVALGFTGFCTVGSFGAGDPLSAISDLV